MKIEVVIFDLDGVLADTFGQTYAVDCEIIRKRTGSSPDVQTYKSNPHRGNWTDFYACFGVQDGEVALAEYYNAFNLEEITTIPGAAEMLKHPSINLLDRAIASVNRDKERVTKKLKTIGLEQYFREEDIYTVKGDKKILLAQICEEYIVILRHALFVSDTANDINAGNQAGVYTVAIGNEYSYDTSAMLLAANPKSLLNDISELPRLIEKLRAQ